MEHKNSIPFPGQGSVDGDPTAALFGRLDALNKEVNGLLNDPNVRRMALEVGIVLLAKKYPALSVLLGTFGQATDMKHSARPVTGRRPVPAKKSGRGIG